MNGRFSLASDWQTLAAVRAAAGVDLARNWSRTVGVLTRESAAGQHDHARVSFVHIDVGHRTRRR